MKAHKPEFQMANTVSGTCRAVYRPSLVKGPLVTKRFINILFCIYQESYILGHGELVRYSLIKQWDLFIKGRFGTNVAL
jgi:hypothetical protein